MSDFGNFIKSAGVGGGGVNALEFLRGAMCGGKCLAIDTDAKSLEASNAEEKILIGKSITRSMSAGGDISLAERAAQDDIEAVKASLENVKLLFLSASLGGGTGSAAAPIVAKIAKDSGAFVVAFCTMPFAFEGDAKTRIAENAFKKIRSICDAAIALPNDEMLAETPQSNILTAYEKASLCARVAVGSLSALIAERGLINADFNALKNTFRTNSPHRTAFSFGSGQGAGYISKAMKSFDSFPALKSKFSAQKANRLLVGVRTGSDMSMEQLKQTLMASAAKFCNSESVIFGLKIEPSFQKRLEIVAIGLEISDELFEDETPQQPEPPAEIKPAPRPRARKMQRQPESQAEFEFVDINMKRGFFEETPRNIYNKEDLDIPTFMRRGAKIPHSKK